MEYVYAALLLNEAGAEINENTVSGVLEGAGIPVEESRVKALIAALEDVDIDEAVEQAQAAPAGGAAPAPAEGGAAEPAAEAGGAEEEAEEEDEEASGEGLGELFG